MFVLAALTGACASSSAKSKPAEPALVIPPPPPRVVPISAEPVLEPVAEIPGATTPAASPTSRTGRGSRETASRPQASEAKPEVKVEAEPAPPPVVPPPAPTGPPPQLRTADSGGAEATIRATVDRARNILGNVDYRRLNTDLRKAYNDAKRFADQADEALKQGNVVFAQGVAVKAETLAKELAGR